MGGSFEESLYLYWLSLCAGLVQAPKITISEFGRLFYLFLREIDLFPIWNDYIGISRYRSKESDLQMETSNTADFSAADIDRHVGERIRRRRVMLGFTQEQLGESLGISYQQIQKYETGANRVSAGRLFKISEILELNVAKLFDGLGEVREQEVPSGSRHVIELVRAFTKISDEKVRASVMSLVRSLAERGTNDASTQSDTDDQQIMN